jgi:iron complex outermembrane receptor protein
MVALSLPALVSAQGVRDLTIEQLMDVDAGRVFGASARMQPVTEAPASVSFITAEEIRRYGYKTLADVLRGVRGIYITDDRNFSWLGIRGFGKPGDYNTRILLLINGHRVNDNVFGQAEVGAEFGLDPAVIERIEVIRGPASSTYGESAVFAVVNVITRTGASLNGLTVEVEASSFDTTTVRTMFGREYNNGVDLAVAATVEASGGHDELYFEAFDTPETNFGIARGLDGEAIGQVYGRVNVGNLTFTGAYGTRQKDIPTASFGTVFNEQDSKEESTDRHTLLDGEYVRTFRGTQVALRGSWDRFTYDGVLPLPAEVGGVATNSVVGSRWTAGSRLSRTLTPRQQLTVGVEFIDNVTQYQDLKFRDLDATLFEVDRSSTQQAAYAQHELRVVPSVLLTTGLRYDAYEEHSRLSPRAALIWRPWSNQSMKYLYGRAFRAPNETEQNEFFYGEGVRSLEPESIDTHEVVWERYTSDWLRTSVSAYWYNADRLITLAVDPTAPLGATYANAGQVRAKGLEFEAQFRGARGLQGMLSYSLQEAIDQDTDAPLPNSPRHVLNGRVSMPIMASGSFVALEVSALGERQTVTGATVGEAVRTNLTVSHPVAPSLEIYGGVRNLFDLEHADPVADYHAQDAIVQDGRTWNVGLRWRLGSE